VVASRELAIRGGAAKGLAAGDRRLFEQRLQFAEGKLQRAH
jgi:hypothetical protein